MDPAVTYDGIDSTLGKVSQVFRYLEALNQLRNPVQTQISRQPWVMWFRDLPVHEAISAVGLGSVREDSGGCLLKVRRPRISDGPEPPALLSRWLVGEWKNPETSISVRKEIKYSDSEELELFEADAERVSRFRDWMVRWSGWAEREKPARQAMALYERVYSLHSWLERESERFELLIGDGILDWAPAEQQPVEHPILLQQVQVIFDPQIPEFKIVETDKGPELFTALLQSIRDVNPSALGRMREELEEGNWHPLGGSGTEDFLGRLVTQLSPRGQLAKEGDRNAGHHHPLIRRSPVMFLRLRNQGFALAIRNILHDLEAKSEVPPFLGRIVGDAGNQAQEPQRADDLLSPNGEDESVLFCKPANGEQLEIAKRVQSHSAVLVQGPPGTGKTHTIGNLISHFLAQGKSVLVTSHTNKALKVVKEQVVEELQPLCVSALTDNKKDLESSIDLINEKLGSLSAETLAQEADALQRQRQGILKDLRLARQRLNGARFDEYRSVVVGGSDFTPTEAARWIAAHESANWIPAPVAAGKSLPLSPAELVELYSTNASVPSEDERELASSLPDPARLLTPSVFRCLVEEWGRLSQTDLNYQDKLWQGLDKCEGDVLHQLQEQLMRSIEPIDRPEPWRLAAIDAGRVGGPVRQSWLELVEQITEACRLAAGIQPIIYRLGPAVAGQVTADTERLLNGIVQLLESGGRLNGLKLMFNRDWRELIDRCQVNGAKPSELEHFRALAGLVRLTIARGQLAARWQRQMAELGAFGIDQLGNEPEQVCRQFIPFIEQCLNWYGDIWQPLERSLADQGLSFPMLVQETPVNLAAHGDLLRLRQAVVEHLPQVVTAQLNRISWRKTQASLTGLRSALAGDDEQQAAIVLRLKQSVEELDAEAYENAYLRLISLFNAEELMRKRLGYLERIRPVAPAWADAIQRREGVHGQAQLPGEPKEAWLWQQLQQELEERGATSLEELQLRIDQLTISLRRVTTELVYSRAWAAQVRRTTLRQRMALTGWKQMMKRVGKGTGKRAPKFLAEARKLMLDCQSAVPVWIMPISRVVENFNPLANHFDVVIIDEASQADILALTVLYYGSEVIVVGDDQQVSPMAVGQSVEEEDRLVAEYLKGIPNSTLYGGQYSIYDLAEAAFEPVRLREHFRCVAPIIQFSNALSYRGRILPLRDISKVGRRPFTVAHRVNGQANGHINQREGNAVVSLLMAAMERPEYADASFGVITMVGDEQSRYIDQLLMRHISPLLYQKHRIQCGTPPDFQGDERDVIFLSLVDSNDTDGPLPLRAEGAQDMWKKRYNVAASRARDQLWVVHSLDIGADLKPDDIRLRLIKHAADPIVIDGDLGGKAEKVESEFERRVLERLLRAGYQVTPQFPAGDYRIDLVVEGNGKRLAVECDGERWHTEDKLAEDMARQLVLERVGWTFVRIRGSKFFRDADSAMTPVFARLAEVGITPSAGGPGDTGAGSALHDEVVRRAGQIELELQAGTASLDVAAVSPRPTTDDIGSKSTVEQIADTSKRNDGPTIALKPMKKPQQAEQVRLPLESARGEVMQVKDSAPPVNTGVQDDELPTGTVVEPVDFQLIRTTLGGLLAKRPDVVERRPSVKADVAATPPVDASVLQDQPAQSEGAVLPERKPSGVRSSMVLIPDPIPGMEVIHVRFGKGIVVGNVNKSKDALTSFVAIKFKSGQVKLHWERCFRTRELETGE